MKITDKLEINSKRLLLILLVTFFALFLAHIYFIVFETRGPTPSRIHCVNRMRSLAYVCLSYSDRNGYLPAYTVDENNKPLHSWRVLILPFIEEEELYKKIRLDEPWDSEYNSQFHDYVIPAYKCRADYPARKMPTTNYFLVTGVGSAFDESGKFFMSKQTRDNKKVFLVESSKKVHWMCPVDVSFAEYNSENFSSGTIRHINVAYTDGSTSMLKKEPFYYFWSKLDIFVYSVLLTLFVLIILQFFYLMLLYFFYFYKCSFELEQESVSTNNDSQ